MQGAFRSLAGGERSLSTLKSVLAEKIPAKQAELAQLKKEHGHKSVGEVSPNKELSVWALLSRLHQPTQGKPRLFSFSCWHARALPRLGTLLGTCSLFEGCSAVACPGVFLRSPPVPHPRFSCAHAACMLPHVWHFCLWQSEVPLHVLFCCRGSRLEPSFADPDGTPVHCTAC